MKYKPNRVFERVYIHAAKVLVVEGWVLIIHSMDAFSEYAFKPVFSQASTVTIEALNELFDNILKDYKPMFHPKQIVFVTNLPEEYEQLFKQTKASHHKFIFNKEATDKAMKGFLHSLRTELEEL